MNKSTAPQTTLFGVPAPPRPFQVLYVEDNADDQLLFQAACRLAQLPIQSHILDSTASALSYLQQIVVSRSKRRPARPDLVLLDLHLHGDPRGGFTILKYIRSRLEFNHVPVVIFSDLREPELIETAHQLGATSYKLKPLGFTAEQGLLCSLHQRWAQLPHHQN